MFILYPYTQFKIRILGKNVMVVNNLVYQFGRYIRTVLQRERERDSLKFDICFMFEIHSKNNTVTYFVLFIFRCRFAYDIYSKQPYNWSFQNNKWRYPENVTVSKYRLPEAPKEEEIRINQLQKAQHIKPPTPEKKKNCNRLKLCFLLSFCDCFVGNCPMCQWQLFITACRLQYMKIMKGTGYTQ